jgi:DNA-binding MarR family transcriptional regulator
MRDRVAALVSEQGELFKTADFDVLVVPRVRHRLKEGWFMQFQDALLRIAQDRDLWGAPRAVLDMLMSRLDFENHILLRQSEVAEKLGMDKATVSRSIAKLEKAGYIERGPKIGRAYAYKLSLLVGWKGKVRTLKEAQTRSTKGALRVIRGGKPALPA